MKTLHVSLWAVLLSLSLSNAALAEKADKNKPMNIEADTLRYDDLNQTSVFTGRVVITKGTIIVRGTRVDVRQDPEGYQFAVVTAEPGKRAYYRQKRDGVDQFMEGESEVIEYDGRADIVKFIRQAEMRRYQGALVNDEVTGNLIVYNNTTDVFTVNAQPTGATTAPVATTGSGGRVRALLAPRNAASAPAAQSSAPVVTPEGSGLRPSMTLGEEKK